jgi:dihydrodipicolinate synthase/N-acetylneuraminate lyase
LRRDPVSPRDLHGVFAVPPLARRFDTTRSIDFEQNDLIVRHIAEGGLTRLLYGGNAFLHHITMAEYDQLLVWLAGFDEGLWAIPSVGPSYGRAMDQSPLIRKHSFPCVMVLPCADPRDAPGLERGYREIAEASETKLIVYLKDENNLGPSKEAGLDSVARLVDDGVCVAIKYAIVRPDPSSDSYLDNLLKHVGPGVVVSGIGERPAIVHMRDWKLPGFTTGSGCIAPRMSRMVFDACARGEYQRAGELRDAFMPFEDLRDEWGPARVLHSATDLAGIARTGAIPPYVSALSDEQADRLAPVAGGLLKANLVYDANSD